MVLVLLAFVLVAWVATAADVVRRRDLPVGRRVGWIVFALLMPLVVVPLYWLVRPLHPRRPEAPAPTEGHAPAVAGALPEAAHAKPDAPEQDATRTARAPIAGTASLP